jgi:pimeloyl-ACP methyl ester carboxylesterase
VEPIEGYAVLDDRRIAYQVIGDGPPDLVLAPSWFSAFDIEWEQPMIRQFLRRLAAFARVIRFDRRGSGASDPRETGENFTLAPLDSVDLRIVN